MRPVQLFDGKYEFDLEDGCRVVAARRHGVDWQAGFEMRFMSAFVAALVRIVELEDAAASAVALMDHK